jgi:dihydrofolate reductase
MRISFVVAMSRNGIIGTDTGLPWHLPQDLRRFRQLTLGKPVIVGRKTIDLIGRPLPDRTNIVLTRDPHYQREGVLVARGAEEARAVAGREASRLGVDEVVVIGGTEVYRLFFPLVDRVYLTIVQGEFDGTVRFPIELLDPAEFTVKEQETFSPDAKNPHPHDFLVLERRTDSVQLPARVLQSLLNVA